MRLLGNAILIEPDKLPERTRKGILVPATAKNKPEIGTVIEIGPRCMDVKKGTRVIFPRKSASVVVVDDKDYYFVTEDRLTYIAAENEQIKP